MQTTPCLSPHELGSLLALHGKGKRLGRAQENGLSVATDHQFSISRVDAVLAESAEFGCGGQKEKRSVPRVAEDCQRLQNVYAESAISGC